VQLPHNGHWGVLALDIEGRIVALNPMAIEILRLPRDHGRRPLFEDLCPSLAGTQLHQAFLQLVRSINLGDATPLRVKVPATGSTPALTVVVAQRAGAPHQITLIAQRDEG
jgi:PAS domain-containing protein